MKPTTLTFLALLAVCTAENAPSVSVTPETAKDRVGQWVMLQGTVSNVGVSKGGAVFLNFGGKHPDELITVYIAPRLAGGSSEQWKKYAGKKVEVDGRVKLRDGKPEIALQQLNLLRIAK